MKKIIFILFVIGISLTYSCKSKTDNADIKENSVIEKKVKNNIFEKKKGILRVVTWNLHLLFDDDDSNNYIKSERDKYKKVSTEKMNKKLDAITKIMSYINADIYAFQEIESPDKINESNILDLLTEKLKQKTGNKYFYYILPNPNKYDKLEVTNAIVSKIKINKISSKEKQMGALNRQIFADFYWNNNHIIMYNVHLPRPDNINYYEMCLRKIHLQVSDLIKQGLPVIVLGDFNFFKEIDYAKAMSLIEGKRTDSYDDDLKDIFDTENYNVKFGATHKRGMKLDRIFVSKNVFDNKWFEFRTGGTLNNEIEGNFKNDILNVSDHYPVYADFYMNKNNGK